jgi:hypothetical protein
VIKNSNNNIKYLRHLEKLIGSRAYSCGVNDSTLGYNISITTILTEDYLKAAVELRTRAQFNYTAEFVSHSTSPRLTFEAEDPSYIIFKNSVRTAKKTPHFTITKINWLTLFKGITTFYTENNTKRTGTKRKVADCSSRRYI